MILGLTSIEVSLKRFEVKSARELDNRIQSSGTSLTKTQKHGLEFFINYPNHIALLTDNNLCHFLINRESYSYQCAHQHLCNEKCYE